MLIALAILIPAAGTLLAWKETSDSIAERNQSRFSALVQESELALQHRINTYAQGLAGGAGHFAGSEQVSREDWRSYVEVLDVEKRFPGINGIGYIANVPGKDLPDFLRETRADGAAGFAEKPAGSFSDHFIITYIEPIEINQAAVGLNIAFETNRKTAALRAMETGHPAISKRILLVQDTEKTPGFLLLHPLYKKGARLDTAKQRVAANTGWIYAPFIARNFLKDLTLSQGRTINLEVYDGVDIDPANEIFDDRVSGLSGELHDTLQETQPEPTFSRTKTIALMQQRWTLVWRSTPQFDATASDMSPLLVLIGGAALTALIARLIFTAVKRAGIVQREVERKTKEISDGQRRLQAVLDTVVDGIVSISTQGTITAFNPSAERIFGYTADEVLGRNVKMLMPEPYQREHDTYLKNYLTTGEKKVIGLGRTVSAQRKDGSVFPMELAVNQMGLDNERSFVASIRDISEREEAKRTLEASEQIFRQAMEQASIGMALVSPSGALLQVNRSLCDSLGYSESQLKTMKIQTLSHPDDLEADLANMAGLLEGKAKSYQMEKRYLTKTRQVITTQLSVSLVRKPDGRPDYFIKQVVDVTERKEMERLKGEFISVVSHELRTPLTSIRGSLGLIVGAMAKEVPAKMLDLIRIAHNNSERLIGLVNDILDIDKLGSGQMHFEPVRENVARILEQALESNRGYAASLDVLLKLEPVDAELEIIVDPMRLAQVLANLLSNAAKFSPGGSEVRVFAQRTGDSVRVSVRDQGPGIPDEFRSRIFTKFAQADSSATRQKGGTGLGLLISKQLIEKMDGHIGFDSVPGEGATFWFDLPVARAGQTENSKSAANAEEAAA